MNPRDNHFEFPELKDVGVAGEFGERLPLNKLTVKMENSKYWENNLPFIGKILLVCALILALVLLNESNFLPVIWKIVLELGNNFLHLLGLA